MMNTIQAKELTMAELETITGGGFLDFISNVVDIATDFVVDTFENMKVPAMNVTEFIGDGLCDKLADIVIDALHSK